MTHVPMTHATCASLAHKMGTKHDYIVCQQSYGEHLPWQAGTFGSV